VPRLALEDQDSDAVKIVHCSKGLVTGLVIDRRSLVNRMLGLSWVIETPRSIIIHSGKLRDFDADQLLVSAEQIVGRVRLELMVRFGMVLSEEGVPLQKTNA